jgi:hypothetical protein
VLVFGASLDSLIATPEAHGRNWDAVVIDSDATHADAENSCGPTRTQLLDEPDLDAISAFCATNVTIGGHTVGAISLTPLRGSIGPTVLAGRAPRAADEVALGTHTLARLDLEVGDRATVRTSEGHVDYRIVGRAIIPHAVDTQAIADGAVFSAAGFHRVLAAATDDSAGLFVRFREGVDERAVTARIAELPGIGDYLGSDGVVLATVPVEVERLRQVEQMPDALTLVLVVLGALAVGHLLVTSGHRRPHDLAILKCLGMRRRQLMTTVVSQAWTATAVGFAIGLPCGVAAGSILWRATAGDVGVDPSVDVPITGLALLAAGAMVTATLAAVPPARRAARVPAGTVLRAW